MRATVRLFPLALALLPLLPLSASCACRGSKDGARPAEAPELHRETTETPPAPTSQFADLAPSTASSSGGPGALPPDGPYRFVGRAVETEDGALRFAWSGSELTTRFQGPSLDVDLEDSGANSFEIVVDGRSASRLRPTRGTKTHRIVSGASPGVHQVTVVKRTEAMVGETVFRGFHATEGGKIVGVSRAPRRWLELIGDSITAALGSEGEDPCRTPGESEDGYDSYGQVAARALRADVINLSWSGVRAAGGPPTMADLYLRALPGQQGSSWAFPPPAPDAVVVNLGDNDDFWAPGAAARFLSDYVKFVRSVRARYPLALIACTTGPMGTGSSDAARHTLSRAVETLSDPRVFYLEFAPIDPATEGVGCGGHPTVKTHARMARTLVDALKPRLGW